jgi:hypothetical protein
VWDIGIDIRTGRTYQAARGMARFQPVASTTRPGGGWVWASRPIIRARLGALVWQDRLDLTWLFYDAYVRILKNNYNHSIINKS